MIYFIGGKQLFESKIWESSTIDKCLEYFKDKKEIQIDTETEGYFDFENKILLLQLGDKDNQFVIEVNKVKCSKLKSLLIDPKYTKILHNASFDYKFIKFHFGWELTNIYDTFLAECILTNGIENRKVGLKDVCYKYTNIELNKDVRGKINKVDAITDEVIQYAALDVKYLEDIKRLQLVEIETLELNPVLEVENSVCTVLADIEYEGLILNVEKWTALAKKAENLVSTYEKDLDTEVKNYPSLKKYYQVYQGDLFGNEYAKTSSIKWSSPIQVKSVLNDLGLDVKSSSEKEISMFQNKYPLVKLFIDYKKQAKLANTYGLDFLKFINKNTGRIHTSFWQILETNRVSSNKPNLQQIPRKAEYLACFIAPEGFKLVQSDFAAEELRLIAEGSKEPVWIDAFNNGLDLHSEMAVKIFDDLKIEDVKKPYEEIFVNGIKIFLRGIDPRFVAKTLNFALSYGASEYKLAGVLGIDLISAKSIKDKYFEGVPKLSKFLDSCAKYGLKNGYIRSFKPCSGLRFLDNTNLDNKKRGEIERQSKNTCIQMAGSMICKMALINISTYIKNNNIQDKVKLCLQVHDAIYSFIKEDFVPEWKEIQEELMLKAEKLFITSIPCKVDTKIADFWKI